MTELDLLRAFFHRWEEFHLLPKAPGRKSKEHEQAAQALVDAARQIKDYVPPTASGKEAVVQAYDNATIEYRQMQQQVAALPPNNGFRS